MQSDTDAGASVLSRNPRTGETITTTITESAPRDVDRAVRGARATAAALATLTSVELGNVLRIVAAHIAASSDTLVPLADDETALGTDRLKAELARSASQFGHLADVVRDGAHLDVTIDRANGTVPDLRRSMIPAGVVAVFAASNFPFAFSVLGGDVASALAARCPVVVKAHPGHPRTSEASVAVVREAFASAGLSVDTIGVVHGLEAGQHLVDHPIVAAIGFTGSKAGGQALAARAAARARPVPFYGELGSINPLIVRPSALGSPATRQTFAAALTQSFTLGHGQYCTKPGVVFLPAGPDGDDAVRRLVAAASNVAPNVLLTDSIRAGFQHGTERIAERIDVTMLTGTPIRDGELAVPPVVATTSAATFANDSHLHDEVFGPYSLLVRYDQIDEVVECLEAVGGSLTVTIHVDPDGDDPDVDVLHAAALGCAGRIVYNDFPTGVAVTWSMQHGGPFPAATDAHVTSVGAASVRRWLRPVVLQNAPDHRHPPAVADSNPWNLPRRINGAQTSPAREPA